MQSRIELVGTGWKTGTAVRVRLSRREGENTITAFRETKAIGPSDLTPSGRSSAFAFAGGTLLSVEHLFAALSGLGIRNGLSIEVFGAELPLLDGAAAAWAKALRDLGFEGGKDEAQLEVLASGEVEVDGSRYFFERASTTEVAVQLHGYPDHVAREALWDGSAKAFVEEIAGARTFVTEDELVQLASSGMHASVDPEAFVVVREHDLLSTTAADAREPARHKLLDLLGDMYAFGGPPRGRVVAVRPGHARSIEAMRLALAKGLLARSARPSGDRNALEGAKGPTRSLSDARTGVEAPLGALPEASEASP